MGIVTTLFVNMTTPLAILSCCVCAIAPWLGSALVGVGGSLLKGIFGGKGKKQAEKRAWERFMKRMELIRPKGQYSRGRDPVIEKMIKQTFKGRGMEGYY